MSPDFFAGVLALVWTVGGVGVAPVAATSHGTEAPLHRDVEQVCEALADRLASVDLDVCLTTGLVPTEGRSVNGIPIIRRDYEPRPDRPSRGRVLLFGGIHGDELSSVSIVFTWMSILERFHTGLFHWRIVPVLNPDGLLQRPGVRMNANGVDLNRNFPSPDWETAAHAHWVDQTKRNPRRYPGPAPLSEPESKWLADQINEFQPDVIVSVHAPHSIVDFDGPPHAPERLGSLHLKLLGTYPGSLGRYAGVYREIPVVTIELPSAFSMPPAAEQRTIWVDLVRWLKEKLPEPSSNVPGVVAGPAGSP